MSAKFRLVAFGDLPRSQQIAFKDLTNDPTFFGLLLPADGIPLPHRKSLFALIPQSYWRNWTDPKILSSLGVLEDADSDWSQQSLVSSASDGVIEAQGEDGHFLSGWAAVRPHDLPGTDIPLLNVDDVSHAAILYGSSLGLTEPTALAARLYFFNRVPWSGRWADHFADVADQTIRLAAKINWRLLNKEAEKDAWLFWRPPRLPSRHARERTFKLYINPAPSSVLEVFELLCPALSMTRSVGFKIGRTAIDLLRIPIQIQKLAYFDTYPGLAPSGGGY